MSQTYCIHCGVYETTQDVVDSGVHHESSQPDTLDCVFVSDSNLNTLADQRAQLYCSGQSRGFIGQIKTVNSDSQPPALTNGHTYVNQQGASLYETDFHTQAEIQHRRKRSLLFTKKETDGENKASRSKFRAYVGYSLRVESFLGWVSLCLLPVWMFAKAGFFYKGFGDIAACFHCGLTYKQWKKDDDPIIVHIQLKPGCHYITELTNQGIRSCNDLESDSCNNNIEMTEVTTGTENLSISTNEPVNPQLLCKVCLENKLEITIQPCGHFALCQSCCRRLRFSNQKCPICRGEIQDAIRTYI